jgi:formylglycine-generating enzyme required for sulfatase activity
MKRRIELPEVDQVQLPHLFGLRPGVLILIILLIVLVAVLFFIAFFPGVIKGGRYVTFRAPLSESGVVVDGTYIGVTDYPYFIESGSHEVQVMKAGISYSSYTLDVDHPVFLTWLFHRKLEAPLPSLALDEEKKSVINQFNLQEIADASAILSYDMVNRSRPLFSNLIQDLQALELDQNTTQATIETALRYISNETMLSEAKEALEAVEMSDTMLEVITIAEAVVKNTTNSGVGLASTAPSLTTKKQSLSYGDFQLAGFSYPSSSLVMGRETPASYPQVNEAGVSVAVPSFVLGATEISQYQWALFVEENPYWDKSNKAELISKGLVDDSYMQGMTISSVFVTSRPVFNVSYHAAQAFCAWLSEKTGKKVFLPTEAMWTLAALQQNELKYNTSLSPYPDYSSGPVSLLGGVWELTQTPYIPLSRLTGYEESLALHEAFSLQMQPIVKGGSYLNDPQTITAHTVGVIEPDACGDQIGFRVAWYE